MSKRFIQVLGLSLAIMLSGGSTISAQKVSFGSEHPTLKQVFDKIEQVSKYKVAYNGTELDVSKKVTLSKDADVLEAVRQALKDTNCTYTIKDNYIVITSAKQSNAKATKKVSGQVLDQNGEPVIGATVQVPGTSIGASTDLDGRFTLTVPEGSNVKVSYVGYQAKTLKAQDNISVTLQEDKQVLDEVVVTALGIKKEAKALSYNVQQIKGDALTEVKDASFINALAGKVAGVQIASSSAGIGGGTKVVMRGAKSLSGNNNALYVIDGIPMPSLQTTQPSDYFSGMGQSGDGASMINPDDIESLSVLSGAAASALYGHEAQNGVIMITTKRGKENHTSLTYSNSSQFMNPFRTPEFQNTYGAATGSFNSWGEKLGTPSSYDPMDFFQTGYNTTNSVTLSTGNDKNQTYASIASTNAQGIVGNNTLDRYNFSIRNTSKMLDDKLNLDLSAMYMNVREQNMVSEGQYFNPIVSTYLLSPSYSLDTYQQYEMYSEARGFKVQYWPWGNMGIGMQNPYWIINRDKFINHKNRFLISGGLTYEIAKGIKIAGRAKMDYTSAMYEKKYSATTDAIFADTYGAYFKGDENTRQIYADAMLSIDKYFGDFSLTANAGASIQDVNYNYTYVGGNLNSVANLFSLRNVSPTSMVKNDDIDYHDQVQSIFATAQLGWQSKIYLDLTARNDWSSALAYTNTKSVAYPSVGVSAILTDLFGIKSPALSFLKVRGSYSEVGNAAPLRFKAYQTYPLESGTPSTVTTYPNNDLKPERTKAWEVGVQSNFWGDKVNLNVSLYKTSTYNQLFKPALAASSGYSAIYINGGQVDNKGLELSLTVNQPLGPVDWRSTFTYSINRNKVAKLLKPTTLEGGIEIAQDHLDLLGIGNVKNRIFEGGRLGDLYVTCLRQDSHGLIDVDYLNNTVAVDRNAGALGDGYIYAGNSQAKYRMGWGNSFSWKGIDLSFLITARVGGQCVSMTQAMMDAYGVSKVTADARDAGYVLINGYEVPAVQKYYQTVGSGAGSCYVYSATNVRLGELSLGYTIPVEKWVKFVKSMNVAFIGRNLFMFYCKAPYDPELTASTGTYFDGMDYFMMPSLRSLGFSVKLNF
ncbi:MAG: SusC/RagA family TonB-linked outer membrane protein [Muribaculaceae bacterium]